MRDFAALMRTREPVLNGCFEFADRLNLSISNLQTILQAGAALTSLAYKSFPYQVIQSWSTL